MKQARLIYRLTRAKVNAGILAIVLFGLVIVGLSGLIIPGWEYHIPGKVVGPENRLALSQRSVIDDIGLQSPETISEELEIQKVRIESSNAGSTKTQFDPGATIRGRVFVGSQGMAGIRVVVWRSYPYHRLETITDEDGFYKIKGLYEGEYRIETTIKEDGLIRKNKNRNVRTKTNFAIECDFYFEHRVSLSGRVYLFGIPKGGVEVFLEGRKSRNEKFAQISRNDQPYSMKNGIYKITGLSPGRYDLFALLREDDRTIFYQREIHVQPSNMMFDIHLDEEGACEVHGYVFLNDHPAQAAQVILHTDTMILKTTSNTSGAYRFSYLPAGRIYLNAILLSGNRKTDFLARNQFELKKGVSIRKDLHIATGCGIIFGEICENGSPKENIVIRLQGETVDSGMRTSKSSSIPTAKGNGYHFDCLPAGRYELSISYPFQIQREVFLKANEELKVDFDFATGSGNIHGVVKMLGDSKESATISMYLFKPGHCSWQEGKTFNDQLFDRGIITQISVKKRKFMKGKLPAGTFDVVAVCCKDGKISALDIRSITLAVGDNKAINLDVTGYR